MQAIIGFIYYIITNLLTLLEFVVIAYIVMTWLVAFNVINTRNRVVYQILRVLESIANPLLRPFRRILPAFGGIDLSPILLFLVIGGVQRFLLPAFFGWLSSLAGGGAVAV